MPGPDVSIIQRFHCIYVHSYVCVQLLPFNIVLEQVYTRDSTLLSPTVPVNETQVEKVTETMEKGERVNCLFVCLLFSY